MQRLQTFPADPCVGVDTAFGWQLAQALAEAAVVDGQHREPQVAQLLETEQMAGEVPAHTVQVEQRGSIGIGRRPPPGVDVLLVAEGRVRQLQFFDAAGQAAEPGRVARLDAKYQFAFLLREHRTADRQANGDHGNQQQAEPAGLAAEQEEMLQGQGLEIRNRR